MPDLSLVTGPSGDVHVGFDADGTFIPFAQVSGARIKQLQDRAADLSELSKSDDPEALKRHDEAAAALPYSTKTKTTKDTAKGSQGGES